MNYDYPYNNIRYLVHEISKIEYLLDKMKHNGLGYEQLRDLALNFTSTHQTENPRGFSEVGENKQLLIANVVCWLFTIRFQSKGRMNQSSIYILQYPCMYSLVHRILHL